MTVFTRCRTFGQKLQVLDFSSTVAAQAGAIQRFSTPQGWKQMGSWLKNAETNADWNRLKLLLSQCSQVRFMFESRW